MSTPCLLTERIARNFVWDKDGNIIKSEAQETLKKRIFANYRTFNIQKRYVT